MEEPDEKLINKRCVLARRSQSGALLIETLAAMAIVTVWITGILMLASNLMNLQASEKKRIFALNIADTVADELQGRLYIDLSWFGQSLWAYDEVGRAISLPATAVNYSLGSTGALTLTDSGGATVAVPVGIRFFAVSTVTRDTPIYGMNTASIQINWYMGTSWLNLNFQISR